MTEFKPRTTSPSATDKNWIKLNKTYEGVKGVNKCLQINSTTHSVLPNCTGYAWGRWRELLGKSHSLSRGDAKNWYGAASKKYSRGKTPKLGAVACWSGGDPVDGATRGHVAIVEQVNSNGKIIVSQSAYSTKPGSRFSTKTLTPPNYKPYSSNNPYVFQGFIYTPIVFGIEPEIPSKLPKPVERNSMKDQIKVLVEDLEYVAIEQYTPKGVYNILDIKTIDSMIWVKIEPNKWLKLNDEAGQTMMLPAERGEEIMNQKDVSLVNDVYELDMDLQDVEEGMLFLIYFGDTNPTVNPQLKLNDDNAKNIYYTRSKDTILPGEIDARTLYLVRYTGNDFEILDGNFNGESGIWKWIKCPDGQVQLMCTHSANVAIGTGTAPNCYSTNITVQYPFELSSIQSISVTFVGNGSGRGRSVFQTTTMTGLTYCHCHVATASAAVRNTYININGKWK